LNAKTAYTVTTKTPLSSSDKGGIFGATSRAQTEDLLITNQLLYVDKSLQINDLQVPEKVCSVKSTVSDPELARLVKVWAKLPTHIRQAILTLCLADSE